MLRRKLVDRLASLGGRPFLAHESLALGLILLFSKCTGQPCVGETCGEGGAGGGEVCEPVEPGACPDPLLAYDPSVTSFGSEYPDASMADDTLVGRIEPFAEDTVCHTVVIGLVVGSGPCQSLDSVDVVVFDGDSEFPSAVPDPMTMAIPQDSYSELGDVGPGIELEVRLPFISEHQCGAYPFVGVSTNGAMCPIVHPATCDGSKGWRFDGEKWGSVFDSAPFQVYAGLADCDPL